MISRKHAVWETSEGGFRLNHDSLEIDVTPHEDEEGAVFLTIEGESFALLEGAITRAHQEKQRREGNAGGSSPPVEST